MNNVRLTAQIVAIFLQIYFFIQTILFHTFGYAFFPFKPLESAWLSMIFTFFIVIACEFFSLAEGILLVISKRSVYGYAYVAATVIIAIVFLRFAYYSTPGTVIALTLYTLLFLWRAINITRDLISVFRKEPSPTQA